MNIQKRSITRDYLLISMEDTKEVEFVKIVGTIPKELTVIAVRKVTIGRLEERSMQQMSVNVSWIH